MEYYRKFDYLHPFEIKQKKINEMNSLVIAHTVMVKT